MKLRCVSCTASSVVCQTQMPQKARQATTTAAATGFFTKTGPNLFSRKEPRAPPLCWDILQSIWFGSFSPRSMAALASSTGTVLQQGQPLWMQKQQSILFEWMRRWSRVANAVKRVSWMMKSMRMANAAYMQKEASAGNAEDTEMAKATKSVRDVTMMDTPAWERAFAMRSGTGRLGSVRSRALMMTKESSTPIPRSTNGRTECTGV
mmetsp:Transcript_7776/g.17845  ORF Transcript_7776/g.17845 Transcript_7776/m.17845 type:complete len:207 (-) Transcript_7776:904-1524(-)